MQGPIDKTIFGFIWRYSKRDQMVLLAVTVALFPLLYLTLELPKRIINDAIGASTATVDVLGVTLSQTGFLLLLCFAFLLSVICHGLLKMRINTMKGVLAERMLRRFRYSLISRALWFPRPYFERNSQGELVAMITAESEPMGGLMGDAISQPVLQAGQMLTILFFLFLQSVWFGLAAIALIPLQAWLIPRMQKQINKLNKQRIAQVRELAAMIGENAQGAATLRRHGGWRLRLGQITSQLSVLYHIRFRVYQKKFFMKFVNNFITQLTPFLFYSIGGILVLNGSVSLGALVAALAAFKDLSSPWKELLAYYNQTQDLSLRWDVLREKFSPSDAVAPELFADTDAAPADLAGDIAMTDVALRDAQGDAVLDGLDLHIGAGEVASVAVRDDGDRQAFVQLLSREVLPSAGAITIAGNNLNTVHQADIAAKIGVASAAPVTFRGSFGNNVVMGLRPHPMVQDDTNADVIEAIAAGNSPDDMSADWTNPALAGVADAPALRAWWLQLLRAMGADKTLFLRALDLPIDEKSAPELTAAVIALRPSVAQALAEQGLTNHTALFDAAVFNDTVPVFDNLLFATPNAPIAADMLAGNDDFFQTLSELGIDRELVRLSRDVVAMLDSLFGPDGTDHPLFRRLGLDADAYVAASNLVARAGGEDFSALSHLELAQMWVVPFRIKAKDIGAAFSDDLKTRIVTLRQSHGASLRDALGHLVTPIDADKIVEGLSLFENALFGRVNTQNANRAAELRDLVAQALVADGLEDAVIGLVYDLPIGLSGANLPQAFLEPLSLTRAAIKRPSLLILDGLFASESDDTRAGIVENLRALLPDTTLMIVGAQHVDAIDCHRHFEIRDGRLVTGEAAPDAPAAGGDSAMSADLQRKTRVIQSCPMFSGLDRKQLRLLAFGAQWYDAAEGDVIFAQGDDPTDGAYVVVSGKAGLYARGDDGADDKLIVEVSDGALVGELGLIRKVPRALDMRAHTDLSCLRIGEEEFLSVVENDAATAYKLLQVVAGYVG